ncbi:hypothetical protein TDB9533_00029 [Thalassocella blandensis]|nr:hypothetical protein TDB9533_00029 [Thalassocella blandensis]
MNLELAQISNVTERFYGKWQPAASNDGLINPDGTITYQAVEGFISPLKQLVTFTKDAHPMAEDEYEEPTAAEYERDVDSRIYTNNISGSLIAKVLIEKFQRHKDLREVYFTIKNRRRQASIHANILDGSLHCTISTASETLRRHFTLEKRELILTIRETLRLNMYVTISDEIIFGRA